MSPLLLLGDSISYLTREHYCFVSLVHLSSTLRLAFVTYGLPVLCLLVIYIRITIFLRRQSNLQRVLIRRRRNRDLVAIRCIFIIVALLLTSGFPFLVFLVMFFITGEEHLLLHRVTMLSWMVSMTGLSIGLVFFTPELKRIVMSSWTKGRVTPAEQIVANQLPMKSISNLN